MPSRPLLSWMPLLVALPTIATASPVSPSPGSIDFGTIPTGTTSSVRLLRLAHVGVDSHEISSVFKIGQGNACDPYTITGIPGSHTIGSLGMVSPAVSVSGTVTVDFAEITFSPTVTQAAFDCVIEYDGRVVVDPPDPPVAQGMFVLHGASSTAAQPEIGLSPSSLDLGTITVGQMGSAQIVVSNTGNAPLTYGLSVTGAGFSASACMPSCTLAGNTTAMHPITFAPTQPGPASGTLTVTSNDADEATLMVALSGAGVVGGTGGLVTPASAAVDFGKVPVGTTATRSITIANTGAGPFELTTATFGSAVFAVAPTTPLPRPISANGATTLELRCSPAGRTTYQATAAITTTADNGNISLSLRCEGSAEVTLPATIDFGITTVGATLRLAEALDLHNIATDGSFVVREVRLVDATGAFAVEAIPGTLEPDRHLLGDASFTPTQVGPYAAQIEVFLDDDLEPHGIVALSGHAVEYEPRGGCATGGGSMSLLLVPLLVLSLRRQRRPRRGATAATATLVLLVFVPAVRADGIAAQTYRPTVSVGEQLFQLDTATIAPTTSWAFAATFGYARDPLQLELVDCGASCPPGLTLGDTTALVRSQALFALGGAVALGGRFEFGAMVPMLVQDGRVQMQMPAASGTALGDVAVHGKARILASGPFALAAGLLVTAPTATADQYAGSDGPTGHAAALASWRRAGLQLAAEGGVLARTTSSLGRTQQGSELDGGVGLSYSLSPRLTLTGEAFGSVGLVDRSQALLQVLAGARTQPRPDLAIGVAAGAAIVPGLGAPTMRALLVVTYTTPRRSPSPRAEVSTPAPRPDPTRPSQAADADGDGDGVPDAADRCPTQAEDRDGFADEDGCPDPDNDGDGVLDAADRCPTEPEDRDGFADDDGCPDPDDDGDGVLDLVDHCPRHAGPAANVGCPVEDRDRDGVPDVTDLCPDQPETINGNADDDGCPDAGDSLVLVGRTRIDLFEPIRFDGDTSTLTATSSNVIAQLAHALRADRTVLHVDVIGHLRARGDQAADTLLARQRAEAVVAALVARGVATSRLAATGAGSSRPLNPSAPADAINDRIELAIRR